MPWMAVDSSGICIPGLILRVLTISSPSGITLTIEISTMRSLAGSTPVVSRSKNMIGRLRFSFIAFVYALIIMGISSMSVALVCLSS